jgi:hypothetical protein
MEVRRTRTTDWEELRELRIRALADAPDAFSSTLEEATTLPEAVWREWAEGGPASVDFLAREDVLAVGMVAKPLPSNRGLSQSLLRLSLQGFTAALGFGPPTPNRLSSCWGRGLDTPDGSPHERTGITEAQGSHPTEASR